MTRRERIQELGRRFGVMSDRLDAWRQTGAGSPEEKVAWRCFMHAKLAYWALVNVPDDLSDDEEWLEGEP